MFKDRKELVSQDGASLSRQLICCCGFDCFSVTFGVITGFSGVVIPQFRAEDADMKLTDTQISWLASLPTLAMIATSILGGIFGQSLGRRNAVLIVAPFEVIGFICQAAAPDPTLLLFGRFLAGAAAGLTCAPTAVSIIYFSERSIEEFTNRHTQKT